MSKMVSRSRALRVVFAVAIVVCWGLAPAELVAAEHEEPAADEAAAEAEDPAEMPLLPPVQVEVPPQAERVRSTSFVSSEDMRAQHAQNMNDYLFSMYPGVTVARRSNLGFMGNNSGFYIRGLRGERVAVFVDGVPSQVNNHFHPLVDQYTPDLIERIEINRGPSAVEHGASAVGGVIDLFTHKPRDGFSGYVQVRAGRFDTREAHGRLDYRWDGGDIQGGMTHRETDGHRPNLEFEGNTLNAKLSLDLGESWTLGVRAGRTDAEIENPGTVSSPSLGRSTQDPQNLAVTLDRTGAETNSLIAAYWNRATVDSLRNGRGDPTGFRRFDESETGVRLKHTWIRQSGDLITVGVDGVEYDDERTNGPGTAPHVTNTESFVSPYVRYVWAAGESTTIDGGVRVTDSSQFGTDVSPEVGVAHQIGSKLALRARAGRAFRVPRVNDVNAPFALPNPDLEPEEFVNAEVGLNYRAGSRTSFDVAVWRMEGDNLIQVVGGGSQAQRVNTGEFTHSGVEAMLALELTERFRLRLGLGVMDLEDDTAQVPEHTFDLGLDYRVANWYVALTSRYAEELFGSNGRGTPLPDYYVADLHIEVQPLPHLGLIVDVDNLTDEEYETIAGYPQVPRAVFFGVRTGWGAGGRLR